jgi:hypothetical protein
MDMCLPEFQRLALRGLRKHKAQPRGSATNHPNFAIGGAGKSAYIFVAFKYFTPSVLSQTAPHMPDLARFLFVAN